MNPAFELVDLEAITEVSIETITESTDLSKQLEIYHRQAVKLIPKDPLSVKQCAAFVETCKVAAKHAETRRKALVDPLNKQVKEHNETWNPIAKGWENLWREVDGRLARFAWEQKQAAIKEQKRLSDLAEAEKLRLEKQAEDARRAAQAAETPQEAAKLEAKADRLELKSEMVATPVVQMQSKTIDLGEASLGIKDPKPTWLLPGWDGKKPLSLLDPLLSSIVGNVSVFHPELAWLIRNSELNPVALNATLKAPGGAASFPKPFQIIDKFGGSTLRGGRQ